MIYLDTSAAVKLIRREPESRSLTEWINASDKGLVSSALLEIELVRAARRFGESTFVGSAFALLDRVACHEIDNDVRRAAAAFTDPLLRSLDAIHLATARDAFDGVVTDFCCYDRRLADAARDVGLSVAAPRDSLRR